MTGEDLGYTPRFDYSLLIKFLNKGLKEEEIEEGPLKILKYIEDNNKKQLKAIEYQVKEKSN